TESEKATQSLSVPEVSVADETEPTVIEDDTDQEPVSTGPKHRKPSAVSDSMKRVQDRINTSISKLSDGFKKPGSKSEGSADSSATTSSDSDSKKSDSGSDSGSDD
ncbi:MAG: hypothetical protein U1C73_03560, partial [Dietzia sp.]|nr:hypothetical protein [Dietzia sp.]